MDTSDQVGAAIRDTVREAPTNPLLFSPLTLRGITIPNRIMVSPMCQYSAVDGYANDWHLVHLGTRAIGGAGAVMLEATAVERCGRISHWDLGIWDDGHVEMLSRIATFVKEHGAVPAIQIGHAGRKASQRRPWEGGGPLPVDGHPWQTIAPSAVPYDCDWPTPQAMTLTDIERVVRAFESAAIRAQRAGFKILELHAAHGYLLNQFLSTHVNHRHDAYGGSFENRLRLTAEIVEATRRVWPDEYPLFVRISATDWTADGWTIEDSVALARILLAKGADAIDVSSGGVIPGVTVPSEPGYQVPFAETIRRETGATTVAVGLITGAEQADAVLARGQADIVAVGRELLRNPYWPLQAADALGTDTTWPAQYVRARLK